MFYRVARMYEVPEEELGEGTELVPSEKLNRRMELVQGCGKKNALQHLSGRLKTIVRLGNG